MSHNSCSVFGCHNYGRKTTDVIYHRFPKDPLMQREWITRCKRADKINSANARVCSNHFLPEDYKRDLQNELLGLPQKKNLRIEAIPSKNIPNWHGNKLAVTHEESSDALTSKRTQRQKAREVRKSAISTLAKLPPVERCCDQMTNTHPIAELSELVQKDNEIAQLKKEIDLLKRKAAVHDAALKRCNAELKIVKATRYRCVTTPISKMTLSTSQKRALAAEEISTILSKCFTKGQIKYLLRGKKRVTWTNEDITNALTLRDLSRKSYAYLREHKYPLPGRTTLQKWKKSLQCSAGILKEKTSN